MATTETYPIGDLRAALERTATDPDLAPDDRRRELQEVRDRINHLLGYADSLLADHELAESRDRLRAADAEVGADVDARVREELIRRGMATAEQCDALGLPSRDEVAERAVEGSLSEAPVQWYGVPPTATGTVIFNYATGNAAPAADPEPEPEPEAEPTPEADALTEAALLDAYMERDGDATEVVVSRDLELVAKRILAAPLDPTADIGPLVGLVEVRVDDALGSGSWSLAGGDAGPG